MWLHDNWARRHTDKSMNFRLLAALNWFLIVFGMFCMGGGCAAGIKSIIDSYATGAISQPFSCADNSG